MTTPQWLTLAIVLCAIVLFASEKVRIDIVALIVVVPGLVLGRVPVADLGLLDRHHLGGRLLLLLHRDHDARRRIIGHLAPPVTSAFAQALMLSHQLSVRSLVTGRAPLDENGFPTANFRPSGDTHFFQADVLNCQSGDNSLHYTEIRPRPRPKVPPVFRQRRQGGTSCLTQRARPTSSVSRTVTLPV